MRQTRDLITEIRRESRNVKPTSGLPSIGDLEICQYLNDAQDRMQSLISAEYPLLFTAQQVIAMVAGTEAYTLSTNDRVFLNNRIICVEYSETGQAADYRELEQSTMKDRNTDISESASYYIRRGNDILVNPIPSATGPLMRVTYERELDDLTVALGNVETTIAAPFAAIHVDVEYEQAELESLRGGDYIQIIDEHDITVITYDDLPVTGYDATLNTITVAAATPIAGHSITDGDYIVKGRNVTLTSELPDACERYLIAYATWRCLSKDRSSRAEEKLRELSTMETDIIKSVGHLSHDVSYIPILDSGLI